MAQQFIPQFSVVAGDYYYAVDCPTTGKPLLFEKDESRGTIPHQPGSLTISCHHCQTVHQIGHPVVRSLRAQRTVQ